MSYSENDSEPSGQALPRNTRLEEFVIERVLGAGGFGITYLARDVSLDRQVVIKENLPVQFCFRDPASKTVAPRHSNGEDADNFAWSLENFSKEAAMLASLDHPGIVKVLRSFQAFGTAYFVMPFVEGITLDDLISQRRKEGQVFTEAELRGMLERALDGLAHLHDRGIYHRDIKPGNILITMEGIPVLIDFGSARQRLSERSMTVIESPGYTPFEQLQSRGNVGPWSDLYALAATLVKVMTGEAPPKANDRSFGDPWQPLAGREELAGRYSHRFLQCLDRALELPIDDRWQNAEEWKIGLSQGEVRKTIKKVAVRPISGKQPPKKSKGLLISAATALLILALSVAWWTSRDDSSNSPVVLPPATGGLVITSEPSGAELLGTSRELLGKTPVELKGLSSDGLWKGQLSLKGYVTVDVEANVVAGETKLVPAFILKHEPQKVIVRSEPPGAEVLEGLKVVGRTPLELSGQMPGSEVAYTLRMGGYEDAKVDGTVNIELLELTVKLKRIAKQKFEGGRAGEEKVIEIAPGLSMTFCWCPPGDFLMGSPASEEGRGDDESQVKVTLTKGFWMGKTEVTQAQWQAVMGTNPSQFKGADLPVENLSWNDAQKFLEKLNARLGTEDGGKIALPT